MFLICKWAIILHHQYSDPFYGYEQVFWLCGRFITHLFACPEYPPLSSVTFTALILLQQLKVICDDTYSNKSWSIVAKGMFQLQEINQMEHKMCQYLEWDSELNVDPVALREF
ncbi:uncharacterized protein F5891DRAFT_1127969 [Suillus fuscotomentosus]|uniref:Cyclin n=1 Tax=Suillus fuscotomentosus TaxID=1912939 RepID=A0AAD4HNH0_9AGAM|nr:uncharacterized protein F5891DRAFT_1127969 [Suillus fuscotomentosus]KAG1901709.1 hypothetical protein F5891DRAFT_1127969 [Suillus fuscotomentosus]